MPETRKHRPARHTPATRPDVLAATARRADAIRLRIAGATFTDIGQRLGIDPATAHRDVSRGLTALHAEIREEAAALRALENARLDVLQCGVWEAAISGSIPHLEAVLAIMHTRARLNGLYAPAKIAATDPTGENSYLGMTDHELREAARQVLGLPAQPMEGTAHADKS